MTSKTLGWLMACALLAVTTTSVQAATLQIYQDKSAWASNVGTVSTEDFADNTLNAGLQIKTTQGQIDTATGKWSDVLSPDRQARQLQTVDSLDSAIPTDTNGTTLSQTRFTFSEAIMSVGGDWDTQPGGHGTKIWLTLLNGGIEVLSQEIPHLNGTFWGLVSDLAFTDMVLTSGTNAAIKETYFLDNLVYGSRNAPQTSANTVATPLPAAFWLFVSGLLGLISIKRRSTTRGSS